MSEIIDAIDKHNASNLCDIGYVFLDWEWPTNLADKLLERLVHHAEAGGPKNHDHQRRARQRPGPAY